MEKAAAYERKARAFRQRMQDEAIIRAAEHAGMLVPEDIDHGKEVRP